jgi:hypothetical protein
MQIIDGRVEDVFPPSPHYAKVAAACRATGMNFADDDYEKIDNLCDGSDEESLQN